MLTDYNCTHVEIKTTLISWNAFYPAFLNIYVYLSLRKDVKIKVMKPGL